jgi:hypothetical protein
MPDTKFDKMVEYGDWLEIFFTDRTVWQLKRQFVDAVPLLNLDYQLPENDLSLQLIEKIGVENLRDLYIRSGAFEGGDCDYTLEGFPIDGEDSPPILAFLKHEYEHTYGKQIPEQYFTRVFESVFEMYELKNYILGWFRGLLKRDVPWEFRDATPFGIKYLVKVYNGIREELKITEKEGYHRVNVFTAEHRQLGIPVDVVLCKIALEYLFAGGQEYFGFCNHCDKFFTSKRKLRKSYCSDLCRVNASKERLKP